MPAPPDMAYWLGQKYSILGKQAEGEFRKNIAEGYKTTEEGGQVAPNAASLRALQGAQGAYFSGAGQESSQRAATEAATRNWTFGAPGSDELGGMHDWLTQGGHAPWGQLPLPSLTRPLPPNPNLDANQPLRPNALTPAPGYQPFRKGAADVTAGKAGKSGPPKGLEQLLPILLAAMQGGGAPGPAGGPAPAGPPSAPGGPGLRKGSANVRGKAGKAGKSGGQPGGQPGGLEQLLPALMAASQASPAASPASASGAAPGALPPMAPAPPPGMARGAADAHPAPGYPFGAGYLFGATAVPGQGSGTVDTVNAKLAPHEAVLNRAAADKLGRGKIAALNAAGVKQMGLRRGTARV